MGVEKQSFTEHVVDQLGGWKWSARLSEGQTTGEGAFIEHRSEHSVFPRLGGHQEKTVHFGQIEFVGDVTPVHEALAQRVAVLARERFDTLRFFRLVYDIRFCRVDTSCSGV